MEQESDSVEVITSEVKVSDESFQKTLDEVKAHREEKLMTEDEIREMMSRFSAINAKLDEKLAQVKREDLSSRVEILDRIVSQVGMLRNSGADTSDVMKEILRVQTAVIQQL